MFEKYIKCLQYLLCRMFQVHTEDRPTTQESYNKSKSWIPFHKCQTNISRKQHYVNSQPFLDSINQRNIKKILIKKVQNVFKKKVRKINLMIAWMYAGDQSFTVISFFNRFVIPVFSYLLIKLKKKRYLYLTIYQFPI